MRRALLLLAAAALVTPAPPPPRASLLAAPAACRAPHPSAVFARAELAAASYGALLLPLNQTCNSGLKSIVAAAVRVGQRVVVAGGGCLSAQPGVLSAECGAAAARVSASTALATRLGWRRVLLTTRRAEPLTDLWQSLADGGLALAWLRQGDQPFQPHAVIAQVKDDPTSADVLAGLQHSMAPVILLLHAPEDTDLENLDFTEGSENGTNNMPPSCLNNDKPLACLSGAVLGLSVEYRQRVLLVTSQLLDENEKRDLDEAAYHSILAALSMRPGLATEWHLGVYRYDNDDWVQLAIVAVHTRHVGANRWTTSAQFMLEETGLDSWTVNVAENEDDMHWSPVGLLMLLAPWPALALLAVCAVTVRAARARRRRRGDAVLEPTEFQYPAEEEPRRIGDGMESMLSCWLQRLHEFGAPEPERATAGGRVAADRRPRYRGDPVHLKYLPMASGDLDLKRKAADVLLSLQTIHHENLNPFIGYVASPRPALVWAAAVRGSLEDVLVADDIRLDWAFRLSLLTDLVRGARHLHASPLRVHGHLSSRNCVIDARWVLRVTDHGLPAFRRSQGLPVNPRPARDLLWTAPELLRESESFRPTQSGDVFSFAIIMQEVIVRGEPYCMLQLTPEEIVDKLRRPPPLIRPSVSMGAAPPEAVSVMRQCWSESPELRPDFNQLYEIFRDLHKGRKINIVDSMFEMLEKYSNNLEQLIRERTDLLDMEKKKTEQLLNRMLPRSVAERLMLGSPVEPEEFADVSIYFSDIVGFTELAARSTPVQVVDLLNELYTAFDAAIEQHGVYKVETIGDAYMVVAGVPSPCPDHAERVATMALHLLHVAGRFRIRHLPQRPLHLRCGIHSGPCCAGVVGRTMPRYCLFGDTVNTAARMESTGAAWRVHLSAAIAQRLAAAGGYRLRSRGLTMVKGKGAMHTYWLLGKDGFDKPLPKPPPLDGEEDVLFETEQEAITAPSPEPEAAARGGTQSADCSPPRDPSAAYARYRCGGGRALRRQWSLEAPSLRPPPYRTRSDAASPEDARASFS